MPTTNAQHLLVFQKAKEHWGDAPAEALMEMLPPAGLDVATKQDVTAAVDLAVERMKSFTWKVFVGANLTNFAGVAALFVIFQGR